MNHKPLLQTTLWFIIHANVEVNSRMFKCLLSLLLLYMLWLSYSTLSVRKSNPPEEGGAH